MDDIYQISSTLGNSDLNIDERKEILDKLKIDLIEIQDEIDSKESQFNFKLSNKINKYKILLNQISDEITFNENSYEIEKYKYMYPEDINILNSKLNNKIVDLKQQTKFKKEKQTELNSLINQKIELSNEYKKNKEIINSKKRKLENNIEITALLEKKNKLIGNKKKNFMEMNKDFENEEKNVKNLINTWKKVMDTKTKKINSQIESTNKLLLKTVNSLRKLNSVSRECKIKNKEVDSLNSLLNKINESLEKEKNIFKVKEEEENQKLEVFKNRLKVNLDTENNKIDEVILLIDERFHNLNNFFLSLKEENLGIVKKINNLENEIQYVERDIFGINIENLVYEKNILERTVSISQDKSCHKYMTFKNVYESKIDELTIKRNKLISKIKSLKSLKNSDNSFEELVNTKNYIYKILNGNC
jgi:hypothetical protein